MKKLILIAVIAISITSCKVERTYHYEMRTNGNILVFNNGMTEANAIPIKTYKKNIVYLTYRIVQKENAYMLSMVHDPYFINDSCYIKGGNKYNTVTTIDRDGDTTTIFFLIKDRK